MAYINVDEVYILNNTGLQVDMATDIPFVDAGFTDTQKAQARANIGAGGSNPNLLDNWYFVGGGSQLGDGVFPINQRGQASYSGTANVFDRWKVWDGADTVVLTANGVQYTSPNSNGIFQYFAADLPDKPLTASVQVNGTIYSIFLPQGQTGERKTFTGFEFLVDRPNKTVGIISLNTTILIQAVKLEVGPVSTLANDAPPDFGEELRKCQRYLWHKTFDGNTQIGCGPAIDASTAIIDIVAPASMRTTPTITFTANVLLVGNGGVVIAASVIGINEYDNHLRLVVSATGLTAYQVYSFLTTTTTTMTVSAEL